MNGIIIWSPGVSLEDIEKQVIQRAFEHYRLNKTATAGALGISIRTLDNKLERYDADKKLEEEAFARDKQSRDHHLARSRGISVGQNIDVRSSPAAPQARDSAQAERRVRMEPPIDIAGQSAVPVPERAEVQEMLPSKVAQGSNRGRR